MNILLIEYLSEIERKTKKATDKADPLLDLSCRWPLMYVWINHPVVRACGLIPDLRSLFHLNRFDRHAVFCFMRRHFPVPLVRKHLDDHVFAP